LIELIALPDISVTPLAPSLTVPVTCPTALTIPSIDEDKREVCHTNFPSYLTQIH